MSTFLNFIFNLIFPYRCIVCSRYLNHRYLCQPCLNKLPIKKQFECIGCQRPTPLGKTCTFCRDTNPLDQLLVVADFKNPTVASLIKAYKYRFLPELALPLSRLACRYLDHIAHRDHFSIVEGNPLLISVPLHRIRENRRGFNQAELLARLIARHYRLDIGEGLIRITQSIPQVDVKDRAKRLSNVRGLYACPNPDVFQGRTILLVDDVCTTGATLNECARILKEAGAKSVSALAIARG